MEYNESSSNSLNFKYLIKANKTIKSPNSPLIKSPYIKIKIQAKNLEKSLINNQNCQNLNMNLNDNQTSNLTNLTKNSLSLEPYAIITLNNQNKSTKPIFHNSPIWLQNFELEVKNNKTDRVIIEFFSKTVTVANFNGNSTNSEFNKSQLNNDPLFLGFQILPIKFIERFGKIGEASSIWLRLINKTQEEYFVKDPKHVLNIDNHDPNNYKVDENIIQREKEIGVPLIKISYEYMDFYHLWLLNCSVHTIIQKEDPINKKNLIYIYKLFIRRNDDLEWYKETTFDEIEHFRNYLIKYIQETKNYPFPSKSMFSYFPLIGSYYSDSNNDVLVEKKFILDNFFEGVCLNMQSYKLDEFNNFFLEKS